LTSDTPRQNSEKLAVGELGNMCLKERSKSLFSRPSALRACRGFKGMLGCFSLLIVLCTFNVKIF
jgi:hypothetical protein